MRRFQATGGKAQERRGEPREDLCFGAGLVGMRHCAGDRECLGWVVLFVFERVGRDQAGEAPPHSLKAGMNCWVGKGLRLLSKVSVSEDSGNVYLFPRFVLS